MKNFLRCIYNSTIKKLINNKKTNNYGYFGDYNSWDTAKKLCTGYESNVILEKVKNSLLKVKNGEAIYERDSVLFNKIQYPWPLLSNLLWIDFKNNNNLNVMDFGGSLGSTYFQNFTYLKHLDFLKWNIVEQKNYVDCGKKFFENENLKFYYTIDNCLKENKLNVIILSGVLQYLEKPYDFLKEVIGYDFKYIIIDRTYFSNEEKDYIKIEKVHPLIFDASYPCWFFNLKKFLEIFQNNYRIVTDFEDYVGVKTAKGFCFEKVNIL